MARAQDPADLGYRQHGEGQWQKKTPPQSLNVTGEAQITHFSHHRHPIRGEILKAFYMCSPAGARRRRDCQARSRIPPSRANFVPKRPDVASEKLQSMPTFLRIQHGVIHYLPAVGHPGRTQARAAVPGRLSLARPNPEVR